MSDTSGWAGSRKRFIGKDSGALRSRKGVTSELILHRPALAFRSCLESGLYALVGVDGKGRIVFINKGVEKLFLYTKDELLDKPIEILTPVRCRRSKAEQNQQQLATPWNRFAKGSGTFCARRKNGTEFSAEVFLDQLDTDEGTITVAAIRELLKPKEERELLRQAQKMQALGRLAGGIAHDFNNLLSIIFGYTELALASPSTKGTLRNQLEEIQKAEAAAASLTHQLLLFSRKECHDPKVLILNDVLTEMQDILRQLLGEHIKVSIVRSADLGAVKADLSELKQVILNLAANARDAMDRGGTLIIETANMNVSSNKNGPRDLPPGRYVMLKLTDTGTGIDEHLRSRLFEPFFTTKKEGTGLGLATVYGIVTRCGGHILVDSALRKGTAFTVYLPRLDTPNEIPVTPSVETESAAGSGTILVVEDKDALRVMLCKYLKSCGYKVLEARDGVMALRKFKRYPRPIHILLTDVVMPTISGSELAMRLTEQRPGLRVLIMSGHEESVVRIEGILNKRIKILRKPFSLAILAKSVAETLQEQAACL